MIMTFADVLLRSLLDAPLPGAPELTRLLLAIVAFSALPAIGWRGGHIGVDLLDGLLSPAARRGRDALVSIACGALLLWPAMRCFGLAARERGYGTVTEYLAIPTYLIGTAIATATVLGALAMIARGAALIGGRLDLEDDGPSEPEPRRDR